MYLKQIDINGFKSFADKTKLQFEPGMIAIVGPNGCGKSNVSDAVRWVLGEQRPKALRCARMPELIFNGTDKRKPLNMAEVSITFADCEGVLDTEFDEVTITRRVFRSGEGQYFINKTLCRLKDIQRLFMGTGIGTTSYSVMAQGQIDVILSAKPEDRRLVFEEAAGITKFKADRKEALRKIEQTEANLLRLTDVIREVKRQIGSLQRQAGKARRYRELRDELRVLDIYLTRHRLRVLDERLSDIEQKSTVLQSEIKAFQESVNTSEVESHRVRQHLLEREQAVAGLAEQAAQAESRFLRAQEVIKVNEQRISEYQLWTERDNLEISNMQQQVEQFTMQGESLQQKLQLLHQSLTSEGDKLEEVQQRFSSHKKRIDQVRHSLQEARRESMQCERRSAEIQQELRQLEERERESLLKNERLLSEQTQTQEQLLVLSGSCEELKGVVDTSHAAAEEQQVILDTLRQKRTAQAEELKQLQQELSGLRSTAAAAQAQVDLLGDAERSSEEYAEGARMLLDPKNPLGFDQTLLAGTIADQFSAPSELRLALEVSMRAWLDGVVVKNVTALHQACELLLKDGAQAAVRLVAATGGHAAVKQGEAIPGLKRLLDQVKVETSFAAAAQVLLGNVYLVDTLAEVPAQIPAGCSVVVRNGAIFSGNGTAALWMPEGQISSPLARRMLLEETTAQLQELHSRIQLKSNLQTEIESKLESYAADIASARLSLEAARLQAAGANGEHLAACRNKIRLEERCVTVAEELQALNELASKSLVSRSTLESTGKELDSKRSGLLLQSDNLASELQEMESIFTNVNQELTEQQIKVSGFRQQLEHSENQQAGVITRIKELQHSIGGRGQGITSYAESMARLSEENKGLEDELEPMQQAVAGLQQQITATREECAKLRQTQAEADQKVIEQRGFLDQARDRKSTLEVDAAESRLRRDACFDHVNNEYGIAPEELVAFSDPAWDGGQPPPLGEIEERVADLNAKIQALGPVNLIAIEEYKELEERHAFLKAQEDDLLKSKHQILDLIAMINKKSSELFQSTFEQANTNFEKMFTKLFNGGHAKLVLLENTEDPLESGIEIIAHPPGKRPQSIALLSGGERTMTAVSLLFAIFMIKPAPFCMLDELDASLDDSNIGRFVQVLKDFLEHSQFLIITHNKHTIAASDLIYGVTQQEKGVTRIVSMRLKQVMEPADGIEPTTS